MCRNMSPAGSEELLQVQEQECILFFIHWLKVLCKHPIAAHTISDLEHETVLQILRAIIGVSSAFVSLFMSIEFLCQWYGKSFNGSSSMTMAKSDSVFTASRDILADTVDCISQPYKKKKIEC